VPDWGLECPQCRYPLRGLPEHRCPECGTRFDPQQLVGTWTRLRPPQFTGQELPLPDFGLGCAACKQPLAGAATHMCPHCGVAFDPENWRPAREWFDIDEGICGGRASAGIAALLGEEYIPYMRTNERTAAEIYVGSTTLPMFRLRSPREFYFDVRWILRRARRVAEAERAASRGQRRWRCAQCGEANPGNFAICWNCEHEKE
jgi:hypothetical protein